MGRNKKAKKATEHDAMSDAGSEPHDDQHPEVTETIEELPAAEVSDDEGTQKKDKKLSKKALQRMEQQKRAAEAPAAKKGKGKKKKGDTSSDDEEEVAQVPTAATAVPPESESESESEDDLPEVYPLRVIYCPNCTFPVEMCEFSGMFEKCKPFLIELLGEEALSKLTEKGRKRKIATEAEKLEALLSREGKNKLEKHVVMEVKSRGKGRFLTYIRGLELFGVNTKELCKDFKKQFATGAGITSEPGQLDAIEVQGEFVEQVAEIIIKRFNIPKDAIFKKEGKADVPLFGERPQASTAPEERKPKKSSGKMALDQQEPDFESGDRVTKAKIVVAEKREKVVKEEPEPRGRLFGPKTTDANRGRGGGGRGACFNCGQEGHMSRDCPTPKSRGGGPGEGRGRGEARGRQ